MITRLPVLTYHSFDDSNSPISVSPGLFRRQMQWLAERRWRTLSIDELLEGRSRGHWPEGSLLITFDDGFRSVREAALPILKACNFTAIVFVVSRWVGRTNEWPGQPAWVPRQPLLDWQEIRELRDAGLEVGAHSRSHRSLAPLPAPEMVAEIGESKREIEQEIGCPVRAFAYPYGTVTPLAEAQVAQHFDAAFTTRLGFVTTRSRVTRLERVDAYYLRPWHMFRSLDAGWMPLYVRARRWGRALRRRYRAASQPPDVVNS